MKSKRHRQCVFPVAACFLLLVIPIFAQAPQSKPAPAPAAGQTEKDRGQILKEIEAAQAQFAKEPDNAELSLRLSRLLYQSGEFERARTSVQPLLDAEKPSNDALLRAADLDYLLGRYDQAESGYKKVLTLNPGKVDIQLQAETKLAFIYYQTNKFARAAELFKGLEDKIKLPHWALMRSFGATPPYQVVWPGDFGESRLPFIVTNPLPIIPIEVQDERLYALIDTGADMFVLDPEAAEKLGIKSISSMTGTFAGGKQAEIGFARAASLKIGNVTLKEVPISILPTKRFSGGFAGGKYTIDGIVGTGVLKQFLATLDYPDERLILRRADEEGRKAVREAYPEKSVVEVPFAMAMTHYMMARGSLDGKDGLNFFVDSGLASEAAFAAPIQTLKYAGIPVPETKVEDGIGGGGGGGFATGRFNIARLGLGPLVQENLKGEYGVVPPESYWRLGFIQDGLISHQFLRQYAWTIDFGTMKMLFVKN